MPEVSRRTRQPLVPDADGQVPHGIAPNDGHWVKLVGALIICMVVAAAITLAFRTSESVTGDRLREMENLALSLSEQTDRALKSLELVQRAVIENVSEQNITSQGELADAMGTMAVHRILRDRIEELPYVDAITIISETGKLMNFSRYWPIPVVNVSDRDYFKALSKPGGAEIFISIPVPNRGTGTMTIYLARRFTAPDGRFLGLVLGAMEQSYFETFFSAIDLGRDGAIALFRDDGAYLVGFPNLGPTGPGPIALASIILVQRHLLTQRRFAEAARHAARHDSLTGLPNRLNLMEHLRAALERRGEEPRLALLLLDLDYFKTVNDALGHVIGDRLLKAVAARVRETVPPGAIVARLGGDEFAILLRGVEETEAMDAARRLIAAIKTPFQLDHNRIVTGGSLGISIAPGDEAVDGAMTEGTLLQQADLALYRAKAEGRGQVRVFQRDMERAALMRRDLELDLDTAWQERQFFLVYQPVCDTQTGRIAGFEALLRWRHPTRGIVTPASFVPAAESMGLILPLGAWMLEEACLAAMSWPGDIFVSVDLSPVQLRAEGLEAQVGAALAGSGLPARRLQLEVPERTLLEEGPAALGVLEGLRAQGVLVALDGFGMSYGAFARLLSLPVDRIKIAPELTRELQTDSRALPMLRALLSLGSSLPAAPIVEGVQHVSLRDLVRQEGFVLQQGDYCGAPLPLARASALARGETAATH
ncbi:MAG: hypothetical protein B7Y84_07060 [Azorhizobium sp. 32-67-21]|nr:MAG: hypothetical protein B7Y84_07060 [Azorhizobium sp. 32-67-21]